MMNVVVGALEVGGSIPGTQWPSLQCQGLDPRGHGLTLLGRYTVQSLLKAIQNNRSKRVRKISFKQNYSMHLIHVENVKL